MDFNPRSLDEIEHSLWLQLLCECCSCNKLLDLSAFEHLFDNPIEWANAAAPVVQAQGWVAPREGELNCEVCARESA